jgi:type II secretory pathway predicted ATPase ExeA
MDTRYFDLTEKPFAIAPNPRYLYMSELHREALAHLLYGINSDGCFILLTGDVGTGKTTICRCLLEQLPEKTDIALILNPKLTAHDLLKTICEELEIPTGLGPASIKKYIDQINKYLLRSHAEGRRTALCIDEAQNLDCDVLEQLRLLTNLETNTQKLLRIILIGQPELRDMLDLPELTQVSQRITSRYHLAPLEARDVYAYIQHRIHISGGGRTPLFSKAAIKRAIKLSGGIPRLINVLCDRALLGAYAENADHVDLKIMKKAGREVFARNKGSRQRPPRYIFAFCILALIIGLPTENFIPQLITKTEATDIVEQPSTENHLLPQADIHLPESESATATEPLTGNNTILSLHANKSKKKYNPPAHIPETVELDQHQSYPEAFHR